MYVNECVYVCKGDVFNLSWWKSLIGRRDLCLVGMLFVCFFWSFGAQLFSLIRLGMTRLFLAGCLTMDMAPRPLSSINDQGTAPSDQVLAVSQFDTRNHNSLKLPYPFWLKHLSVKHREWLPHVHFFFFEKGWPPTPHITYRKAQGVAIPTYFSFWIMDGHLLHSLYCTGVYQCLLYSTVLYCMYST